ncbi:MAG TPA: NUDIX domain-containing protein [Actinomycetota bacterium]|jgi:ADP-ribose pyrophosphatase YjhB (NUDIX family)|nr:NUDIX domain-containing protein [Actinomycetota bacterium]
MTGFRFCPWCGDGLEQRSGEEAGYCARDDRVWYRNAAPTVGAAIVRDGRCLVTVRGRPPEEGRVDVPGGFLRVDETPVEGLKRELREELGVEVEVSDDDYVQAVPHVYGDRGDVNLAIGFVARLAGGTPTPADDVAAFKWVTEEDLDDLDFAWEQDRDLARKALQRAKETRG